MWPPCHGGSWSSGAGGDIFAEPRTLRVGGSLEEKQRVRKGGFISSQFLGAYHYLLLRYDPTPTLLILMHDSFYYLIISLISINFFINFHTCFTLFSRPVFMDLGGCYGLYRTFPTSNLTPGPRLGFSQTCFSFRSHT